MKMTKKFTVLIAAFTLSSSMAFAIEGGVGNGGITVVCRDSKKTITSAEVLDIYEGTIRYGLKYDNLLDVETKIELAQLKLVKNPSFLAQFQDELAKVRSIMTFIPKGNSLTPTNDALPKIKKDGCDFEQLANYTDENLLLVSQEIYDELDELNKAAILVHEAIYSIFRSRGDKDSQRSRKLTAQLLANNADQKVIDEMIWINNACGLSGSVEQRIQRCSSIKRGFALVTRTKEGIEVHKELSSGLLWSDTLRSTTTHYNAQKACYLDFKELAGIVDWKLPSIEEYKEAEKSGIRKALPNMNYTFWSSSVDRNDSSGAWVFNGGEDGRTYYVSRNNNYSVRCVAR